jgi:murein DD-endopeptidase MepM/ murein hydrolase activator NlpD
MQTPIRRYRNLVPAHLRRRGQAASPPKKGRRYDRLLWQTLVCAAMLLALTALKVFFPAESLPFQRTLLDSVRAGADYRGAIETLGRVITGEGTMAEVLACLAPGLPGNRPVVMPEHTPVTETADTVTPTEAAPPAAERIQADPLSVTWTDRFAAGFMHLLEEANRPPVVDPMSLQFISLESIDDTLPLPFGAILPDRVDFSRHPIPFQTVPPVAGRITSPFGYREHPVEGGTRFHYGVDIGGVPSGTVVRAFAEGTVEAVGRNNVYGNYLILRHADGFSTFYGHFSRISVRRGQSVGMGQEIGRVGQTGMATGPHLHFEVRYNGLIINPSHYIDLPV